MTTSTEDLDRFTNSLSSELGIETLALLSAEKEERPFIGAEALAAYAVYLLGTFASAFLESLKNELKSEAQVSGKKLADVLINQVKSAVARLRKPAQTTEPDRRQALSTVDDALRQMVAYPGVAVAIQAAERAGHAKIVAELKAKGMADAEAQEKADRLMRTIMMRMTTA